LIRINARLRRTREVSRPEKRETSGMTSRSIRFLCAAAAVALLAACAPRTTGATSGGEQIVSIEDGRDIAEEQCGRCHAPGLEGDSPRADAPPFRTILARYRAETLTEELISGIKLGHPDMPLFEFNPQGVDDLVAYLKSIQQPPAPGAAPDPR
jgi:mono/diheme cytochrome c family protein